MVKRAARSADLCGVTTFASDATTSVRNRLIGIPDLDIPYDLVVDLVLRRAFLDDTTSVSRLSDALGLPIKVIDIVFEELRTKKYADVQGLVGNDYIFTLTAFGRQQAAERFTRSKYASVAPVSLASYTKVVTAQRPRPHVRQDDVRHAFADLIVYDELLDQIGPSFTAQESLFLYGPSGTGKTSIGERLIRLYHDGVLVPRAVEVDGQIITVFDPLVYHPLEPQPHGLDPRWVACYRPIVTVGGELELSMLQLSYDTNTGIYSSPPTMTLGRLQRTQRGSRPLGWGSTAWWRTGSNTVMIWPSTSTARGTTTWSSWTRIRRSAMEDLPVPGGPYRKIAPLVRIAGPSSSRRRSLITRSVKAARIVSWWIFGWRCWPRTTSA